MRDDYKMTGKKLGKLEIEVEAEVIELFKQMASSGVHTVSELLNTAMKRFATSHKDFLPRPPQKK